MSHVEGNGEGNGLPPPGANGITGSSRVAGGGDGNLGGGAARFSSLSLSFRAGGDLPKRSVQERKELEEKGETEDEQEEEWEEEEEEMEMGLGAEGDVPSRVTTRKRRGQ